MSTDDQTPAAMPSSDELFRSAMEPQAPPAPESAPPAATPPAPTTDETGRLHGPDGRYVAKDGQAPEAPVAATAPPPASPSPTPPQGAAQEEDGNVPSWRHRELREQRDAEAARARYYEQLINDQQRQLAALQARFEQPAPAPEVPDMIADPAAYHRFITEQRAQERRELEANFSFRIAHMQHRDVFEQAWNTMMTRAQRGDPSIVQQVMRSPDPGMAMVNWFRRESTLSTVGDDPQAWAKQTVIEQIKTDPKFAGEIAELIRGQAPATSNGAPNVQLPPSLNRVSASAPVSPGINGMPSDSDMFRYAFREGR